jgi:hypothetical protein
MKREYQAICRSGNRLRRVACGPRLRFLKLRILGAICQAGLRYSAGQAAFSSRRRR